MASATDSRGRPRVVITGLGMITPCGTGLEKTWPSLLEGRSGIKPIESFDCSEHPAKIAGEVRDFDPNEWLDAKEARRNDRFIQFAMTSADMAMKDADLKIAEEEAHRAGVIVGAGLGGLSTIERDFLKLREHGPRKVSPFFIPALIVNLAPGQISIRHGAKGPNWSPVSACSTSAHAIGEAAETIRRGAADVIISGGSEATITPLGIAGFTSMKALSTRNDEPEKASRPWDRDRDGFVMGEGAGILILESLEHAEKRGARIYAEVVGYGATADAFHITAPDGDGAARSMRLALDDAGVTAEQVGYINAHGTSTPAGDEVEIRAIKDVYGSAVDKVSVSSTKSMHGHLLGAAGAVETIVASKALETGLLPPTINLDNPSEGCDIDLVPHKTKEKAIEFAMSNSFGFGGTNCSLLLRRWT